MHYFGVPFSVACSQQGVRLPAVVVDQIYSHTSCLVFQLLWQLSNSWSSWDTAADGTHREHPKEFHRHTVSWDRGWGYLGTRKKQSVRRW